MRAWAWYGRGHGMDVGVSVNKDERVMGENGRGRTQKLIKAAERWIDT